MSERKIDIYNHVMPRAVADRIHELAPGKGDMVKRITGIPMLYDIEARVAMMEQWPGYQQVLTLSVPPLETITGPGRQRRAQEDLQAASGQVPGVGGLAAAQQCRRLTRRNGPRDRIGGLRHPDLHQCQWKAAR